MTKRVASALSCVSYWLTGEDGNAVAGGRDWLRVERQRGGKKRTGLLGDGRPWKGEEAAVEMGTAVGQRLRRCGIVWFSFAEGRLGP